MNTFEIIRLVLTAIIPILGWWCGWWIANNNFKKQRYDKVKEKILLDIKSLKDISISHYTKRDNSSVYIVQSFKELANVLIEEKFMTGKLSSFTKAWGKFRVSATKFSDDNVIYKHDSEAVRNVLIAYNALHKELLKHNFNNKK